MKLSSISTTLSLAFASALIFTGAVSTHAQLVGGPSAPGQNKSITGQPPSDQSGSIIGQPPVGQSGIRPANPNTGSTGPAMGSDPVKDQLNRTNREAADMDRDGRISPEEASRMPPGTPLPR